MVNCKKCFIPGNYPGISIDDTGLCNLCRTFTPTSPEIASKFRAGLERKLSQAANDLCKKKYKYHCAVALSGGKDSAYTVWLLSKKYKLNVLAITVDIGFLRAQAYKNISCLTKKLGVDHVFIKDDDLFRTTYKYALTHNFFSRPEGLACFLCSELIPNMVIAYAREHDIPWVARGIFDIKCGRANLDCGKNCHCLRAPQLFFNIEEFILSKRVFGTHLFELFSDKKCLFTSANTERNKKKLPLFLHPLNTLVDYDDQKMIRELAANVGIKKEHFFSENTTCVISMITMYLYQKARGYNPYCVDVCNQIRHGIIKKGNVGIQDALMHMADRPETKKLVAQALRSIGVVKR